MRPRKRLQSADPLLSLRKSTDFARRRVPSLTTHPAARHRPSILSKSPVDEPYLSNTAPHASQGRRIREACGHMRRPWKRDGPSTFPARRNASSPKNCERTSRVRMCARLPRVFGLSHFLGPIQIFQSENLFASLFNPKTSLPGQLGRRRTDFRPKMVSRVTPKALPELPRCAPESAAGGSVTRWETRLGQDTSTQRDLSFSYQKTTDPGRQNGHVVSTCEPQPPVPVKLP